MSAIAVFRPEIGSKSLAAHAARSITRVVESIAQRFHTSNDQLASNDQRRSNTVDSGLINGEPSPLSTFGSSDQSRRAPAGSERRIAETVSVANATVSVDAPAQLGVGQLTSVPPKYSSPPVTFFASLVDVDSAMPLARDEGRAVFTPQARERQWMDCAVAAICSGIPGPAMVRSTPQALGKPPSV